MIRVRAARSGNSRTTRGTSLAPTDAPALARMQEMMLAAFGDDEEQAAEHRCVLHELDALHRPFLVVLGFPEAVPGERRRHERGGEYERRETGEVTGTEERTADHLYRAVRSDEGDSVVGESQR